VILVDADCTDHTPRLYDLNEPDTVPPAIDIWGQPVVGPSGQIYRAMTPSFEIPQAWTRAFCSTDWTEERRAYAASHGLPSR
jgi:hypothetical protein